MLEQYLR